MVYLLAKLETLKKRIAKKKVPFEGRISNEYLEAVVHAYEHFFFHYKSSDPLVIVRPISTLSTGTSICRNTRKG